MGFGNNNFNNNINKKIDTTEFTQNQYSFNGINSQKTSDYKSPAFDFNIDDNNIGGLSLQSKPAKVETK